MLLLLKHFHGPFHLISCYRWLRGHGIIRTNNKALKVDGLSTPVITNDLTESATKKVPMMSASDKGQILQKYQQQYQGETLKPDAPRFARSTKLRTPSSIGLMSEPSWTFQGPILSNNQICLLVLFLVATTGFSSGNDEALPNSPISHDPRETDSKSIWFEPQSDQIYQQKHSLPNHRIRHKRSKKSHSNDWPSLKGPKIYESLSSTSIGESTRLRSRRSSASAIHVNSSAEISSLGSDHWPLEEGLHLWDLPSSKTPHPKTEALNYSPAAAASLDRLGGLTWPVKRVAEIPGDIVIGGLHMVHEREDLRMCGPVMPQGGLQAAEMMLYTVEKVNQLQIMPRGLTLGAHILDDCDKDTYGLQQAVDFIKGRRRLHDHTNIMSNTYWLCCVSLLQLRLGEGQDSIINLINLS